MVSGQDKLMSAPSDAFSGTSSGNWIFKNKERGKASAVLDFQELDPDQLYDLDDATTGESTNTSD